MGIEENQFYEIVLIITLIIAVILGCLIAIILLYHWRYVKLQKERIFAEITIQENERKRIADSLYDSLGPLLSSVKLNMNSIDVGVQDQEIINKASQHIDEIIDTLRQISYSLLPNTLQRCGLTEALREFIEDIKTKHNVQIQFHLLNDVVLSKEKEIHVFRIVQEMINNTLKHANAKNLCVGIREENANLQVMVNDDGKGFDIAKTKKNCPGLGLKSLESRIEMLKGQMTFDSFPNKGTNYFFKVPL